MNLYNKIIQFFKLLLLVFVCNLSILNSRANQNFKAIAVFAPLSEDCVFDL